MFVNGLVLILSSALITINIRRSVSIVTPTCLSSLLHVPSPIEHHYFTSYSCTCRYNPEL